MYVLRIVLHLRPLLIVPLEGLRIKTISLPRIINCVTSHARYAECQCRHFGSSVS